MRLDPDRAAALLDRLYRTAILITKDPHEAEDLVQDTYELILRRPRELKGTSELHYMRAAMRRRHVDRHREATRRVAQVELDSAPEVRGPRGRGAQRARRAGRGARRDPRTARDPPQRPRRHVRGGADVLRGGQLFGVKRGTVMSRVFRAREALVTSLAGAPAA